MLCHPAISAVLVQQQAKHFMTRHCHPVRYVMRTKNRLERVLSGGGGGACRRQLVDWRHILCPPCGRLEMCSSVFCEMRLFSILKRAVDVRNNGRRVWSERGGEGATPGIVGREQQMCITREVKPHLHCEIFMRSCVVILSGFITAIVKAPVQKLDSCAMSKSFE